MTTTLRMFGLIILLSIIHTGLPAKSSATYHGNLTRVISGNEDNVELYSTLIGVLEKLDILSITSSSCHTLEKIVRQVKDFIDSQDSKEISVTLYFQANTFNHSQGTRVGKNRPTKDLKAVSECKNTVTVMSDAHQLLQESSNNNSTMNNTTLGIIPLSDTNSRKNDDNGGVMFGLSHTQVVVISTCSAIIGTFFFVAAIMRIRNYMKRVQAEQNNQRRQTFRSCSFALANNSPSRDSNKTSPKKDSYTVRMPKAISSGKISSNGSRTIPDTKPLLTTSPSPNPNLPSKLSNTSLQFIDEDIKTVKTPETEVLPKPPENPVEEQPLIMKPPLNKTGSTKSFTLETTRGWTFDEDITEAGRQGLIRANSSFDESGRRLSRTNSSADDRRPSDGCDRQIPLTRSGEATLANNKYSLPLNNISSIPEEIPSPVVEYSNFGLTQSDENLSTDGNHFYSYGNQTEYVNNDVLNRNNNVKNSVETSEASSESQDVINSPNSQDLANPNVQYMSNVNHSSDVDKKTTISHTQPADSLSGTTQLVDSVASDKEKLSVHFDAQSTATSPPKHKRSLQRIASFDEEEKTTFL